MKKLTILALAVVVMVGCAKEESTYIDNSSNAVKFTSGAISRVTTVAVPNDGDDAGSTDCDYWEYDDEINIITDGFEGVNTATDYANVKYVSDIAEDGDPAASTGFVYKEGDSEIVFPNVAGNTSTVNFYACYPYTEYKVLYIIGDEDAYGFNVSIENQKGDYGSVDFMTATPVTKTYGSTATNKDVDFVFNHRLAKVVITVGKNDNLSSLDGLTASVNNIYNTRGYSVIGGLETDAPSNIATTEIDLTVSNDTVTAILHPMAATDCANATINFSVTEGGRTFSVPFNVLLTAGFIHNYSIDLGNDYPEFKAGSTITDWNEYNGGEATELVPTETTSSGN